MELRPLEATSSYLNTWEVLPLRNKLLLPEFLLLLLDTCFFLFSQKDAL